MDGKGPSSLPCVLARDGEELGFMSLPMGGKEGKEEGEGKQVDEGGVAGGVAEGRGGVVLRGGVWVLRERLLASWKER